ncbi:hypothetical protein CC2G_008232 [Coprinopsis cinerea AmutBmut pab1-1]|nr:hypothetical protein CC2G_008232 [Coprinopsis cinerea AmutBmut pab1-1]
MARLEGLDAILQDNDSLAACITSLHLDMYPYRTRVMPSKEERSACERTIVSILLKLADHLLDLEITDLCLFSPKLPSDNVPKTCRDIIARGRLRSFTTHSLQDIHFIANLLSILPSTLSYVVLHSSALRLATATTHSSTISNRARNCILPNATTILVQVSYEHMTQERQDGPREILAQREALRTCAPKLYRLVLRQIHSNVEPERCPPICYSDRITHLDILMSIDGDKPLEDSAYHDPDDRVNIETTLALGDGLSNLQQLTLVLQRTDTEEMDKMLALFDVEPTPRPPEPLGFDELQRILQACTDWERLDRLLPPHRFPKLSKLVVDIKTFGFDSASAAEYEGWLTETMIGLRSRSIRISVAF